MHRRNQLTTGHWTRCYILLAGHGPFTVASAQGTILQELTRNDKDYVSVADEVSTLSINSKKF